MKSLGIVPAILPLTMPSIADDLRAEQQRELRALSPAARLALALRLGERDLGTLQAARGLDRETALRAIRAQRQRGRAPSSSMQEANR